MGKKCRRVLFYSVKCRNVENDIFGKGKTKNVVDAKSIEGIFSFFGFIRILSDFVFNCCPNNFVNFIEIIIRLLLRFLRAIRSGDVTNLLETMSRLSDKVCRKGHVLH